MNKLQLILHNTIVKQPLLKDTERKQLVSCLRENFIWLTILRPSIIFSSKQRINPYLKTIDEIWQWNVESVICKYMANMKENIKFGKFDPIWLVW